jgi:transmembrane sensor
MTIRDQENGADALDREAHRWVTQLVSGEASTSDADAITRWRNQSAAHEAAFVAAIRQWRQFGLAGQSLRSRPELPVWQPPIVSRRAVLGGLGTLGAAMAGYAVVQPPLGLWPSFTELTADYRTATGEQRDIMVADNISVRMSAQTSITIPVSQEGREQVELIAGEAAFISMSDRELEVLAGDGRTLARQARFDVRNIGSTVCVTCFEGELRVEVGGRATAIGSTQQIRYGARGLQPTNTIDPIEAAAWHDGHLIFHLTPLSEVIAEINRFRPGRVILMNASVAQSPVNGRFSVRRVDEVLRWIEIAFGVRPRALPGGILLLS